MHFIDWTIVAATLALVVGVALYTRRFVKSVADFLAAGRCAGRYLLANARGESDSGLANTMSKFEMVLVAGLVMNFLGKSAGAGAPARRHHGICRLPLSRNPRPHARAISRDALQPPVPALHGRARISLGHSELRHLSAISARFFIYFLNLPTHVGIAGFDVSVFAIIMFSYLLITVFLVTIGGQVTLMVTDCVEGILSHLIYVAIVIAVLCVVSWSQIVEVMSSQPTGHSMINPFDAEAVPDFNWEFVLMYVLIQCIRRWRCRTSRASTRRRGRHTIAHGIRAGQLADLRANAHGAGTRIVRDHVHAASALRVLRGADPDRTRDESATATSGSK